MIEIFLIALIVYFIPIFTLTGLVYWFDLDEGDTFGDLFCRMPEAWGIPCVNYMITIAYIWELIKDKFSDVKIK